MFGRSALLMCYGMVHGSETIHKRTVFHVSAVTV